MRSLRLGLDNRVLRYDMLPIVAAVLLVMYAYFAANVIWGYVFILTDIARHDAITVGLVIVWLLLFAITTYLGILFSRFLLPFFGIGYSNAFFRFTFRATEPILKPIRRFAVFGAIDFSPIFAILILNLLENFIRGFTGRW